MDIFRLNSTVKRANKDKKMLGEKIDFFMKTCSFTTTEMFPVLSPFMLMEI